MSRMLSCPGILFVGSRQPVWYQGFTCLRSWFLSLGLATSTCLDDEGDWWNNVKSSQQMTSSAFVWNEYAVYFAEVKAGILTLVGLWQLTCGNLVFLKNIYLHKNCYNHWSDVKRRWDPSIIAYPTLRLCTGQYTRPHKRHDIYKAG